MTCRVCLHFHTHDHCPFCGAFAFCTMGKWVAVNWNTRKRMVRAYGANLGRRSIAGLAERVQQLRPPSARLIKRSIGMR